MSHAKSWPPPEGLTSKIVSRKDAILQLSYSTNVHAPASLVLDTVLHVAQYPKWNTWVPSARIVTQASSSEPDFDPNDLSHMRIGSIMQFDVVMDANKPNKITPTPLRVVDISTPSAPTSYLSPELLDDPTFTADTSKVYRVSWTGDGGFYSYGMKLERFHEIIVVGENDCEVRTWEIMSGILSRVVKLMYEDTLKEKVREWCEDLKKRCEKMHADGATL
ncbi:hypothetical protein N0V83_009993 [Neocucurbitaria cava]|uniref:Coenzyme Q-binding protein COQ10 START domain-containing protein n=1 Tax=Neocucurbitaria cava TaxID=798079 RepID=A0A9W9CHK6_9PLEO|nr:hypothetical protein N0V83_009993 [Neocucurbitaria cava]